MAEFARYPSLEKRAVFVTGGATGIGEAIVRAFCQQGAAVGFVDIDTGAADKLCCDLAAAGSDRPWFRDVNVTDVSALKTAIADYAAETGGLGVLVNNVADDTRLALDQITEQRWRTSIAVNLDAAFFASQAAIPLMRGTGSGNIINIGSINALLGATNMPSYVAAKSALLGLTKALAREFGPDGVRVNAVLPGWVVTERQLTKWLTPEAEAEWTRQVPLKERILPRDIANLVLFLSADDSRMITGQQFIIDGGRT